MTRQAPTRRTALRRHAERGHHDEVTVAAILDEALVCHVGFAIDGRPWVVPMLHGRAGDRLYLHGAVGNHLLRSLADGVEACATATLLDGLVLARSAFHHSVNYRSVMVFGTARLVDDDEEKREALDVIVDHALPGRAADARPGSPRERALTSVVALPLEEASAKIRSGGPVDDEEDLGLEHWAGVLPLEVRPGAPVPAEDLDDDVALPAYLAPPRRPGLQGWPSPGGG
jgi:uncharacterized protein